MDDACQHETRQRKRVYRQQRRLRGDNQIELLFLNSFDNVDIKETKISNARDLLFLFQFKENSFISAGARRRRRRKTERQLSSKNMDVVDTVVDC